MSYLKSVDKKLTKGDLMKNQKEIIIDLFYIEHLKVKEIAENVNLSSAYITKIIKQDTRYNTEKLDRKNLSTQKRNSYCFRAGVQKNLHA